MKPVTLRPLATFCLSFYLFAIIVSTDSGNKLPIAAALFAFSVLLFFIFRRTNRNLYVKSVAIIVLALSAAFAFTAFTIDKPMREYSIYEGEHHVTGKICNVEWTSSYSCGYVAKIMEVDGETVELKVALSGMISSAEEISLKEMLFFRRLKQTRILIQDDIILAPALFLPPRAMSLSIRGKALI